MILSERITKYLDLCEPAIAGQRGHDRTFAVAAKLTWGFGLNVEQAYPFMLAFNTRCQPWWRERDLRRKLEQALTHHGHTKRRGYLLGEEVNYLPTAAPLPKLELLWPQPDVATIDRIVSTGLTVSDLWELGPLRFEDNDSHAEEIIDLLFPDDPLLCVGKSSHEFATRHREVWRNKLANLPFIVPAPMLAIKGRTQHGRESEHTKEATGRRVYQVIEFDFSEFDKNGRATIWTPNVRKWRSHGIEIGDACVSLILHLRNQLKHLACVCYSGGRSLHAWFRVQGLTPVARRQFMQQAVLLGADKATWNRCQF